MAVSGEVDATPPETSLRTSLRGEAALALLCSA
jgi:hypothetical protein